MKTTVSRFRDALVYAALLALLACQHDPWADRFVTVQLSDKEVTGTYVIDADSQKRRITLPMTDGLFPISSTAKIVLSADHTAEFTKVPEDYEGTKPCSVTGRGSWSLGKNDKFSVVRANIHNEETNSPCKGYFELMIYGRKPPYKLHITIGDPDSGYAVQFVKQ